MSVDEIEDYYEIEHDYAALLIPGAIIYKKVLDMLGAESVWIPGIRLCDGIAAEYAEESRLIKFHHDFEGDILSSARNMAKRYKCYAAHTQEVERTAVALFNANQEIPRPEQPGEVAAADSRHPACLREICQHYKEYGKCLSDYHGYGDYRPVPPGAGDCSQCRAV